MRRSAFMRMCARAPLAGLIPRGDEPIPLTDPDLLAALASEPSWKNHLNLLFLGEIPVEFGRRRDCVSCEEQSKDEYGLTECQEAGYVYWWVRGDEHDNGLHAEAGRRICLCGFYEVFDQ